MNRRTFLSTAAGTGVLAVAGCTARSADDPDDGTTTDDPPDGFGDTIDDVGCPSFVEDADRTNCYRAIDRGSVDVFLEPSALTFEEYEADDEVETIRFTLHNDADRDFGYNPHDWAVYRYADDGWLRVAPREHEDPLHVLEPGGTDTWSLSTEPHPSPDDGIRRITADMDSGHTHAFRVVGDLGRTEDATRIECVAVFDYLRAVP